MLLPVAQTISVTDAARNFSEVVNKVFYRGESMELTRSGKVVARLVPAVDVEPPPGRDVVAAWKALPRLEKDEADAFAKNVASGRESLNRIPTPKWD